jgi:hypothetical protein
MLTGLTVVACQEEERQTRLVSGGSKHLHAFQIIAQRPR